MLSYSFKTWAHLDISSKYSSLQTLAKESFPSLAFQVYRFFFFSMKIEHSQELAPEKDACELSSGMQFWSKLSTA